MAYEPAELEEELIANPEMGSALGSGLYKMRIASKSKGKGKSGGFRLITYLVKQNESGSDVYLITIYNKSEESSIGKAQLKKLVQGIVH